MYLLYLLHKSFFFLGLGVNRYRATTPSHTCIYTVRAHPFRLRFRLFFHHLLFCWAIMRHFGLTKTMNVRGEIKKGGLGRNLITARLNLLNIEGQRDEIGISILCVWFAQVLVFYPQNTPCEPSVLRKNMISFFWYWGRGMRDKNTCLTISTVAAIQPSAEELTPTHTGRLLVMVIVQKNRKKKLLTIA